MICGLIPTVLLFFFFLIENDQKIVAEVEQTMQLVPAPKMTLGFCLTQKAVLYVILRLRRPSKANYDLVIGADGSKEIF